jgi:glutamate/tyrosine decarboxylase-like PLP-dependent enzyme
VAQIPARGRPHDELLEELAAMRDGDARWKDGRVFSLVYHAGDAFSDFLKRAHNTFFSENALNPMAFPSLRRMERDVVKMTASLLHGGPDVVGTMTSGGTESILLAVKTYRDLARARRGARLRRPNMVLPRTAHVAFDKAAHYFDVEPRFAPVTSSFRADVEAMRRLVDRDTVMLVASAPQYPHGVVDPVDLVAEVARDRDIPLHVDACVGGFVLPWVERLGHPLPRWDFRVDGVTSISADVHKYGFAAKGASVVLYRSMDILRHQFFVATDWPGGIYASPTMPGTRSGGAIAAAWAALQAMGEDGYLDHTRRALEAARIVREGIAARGDLTVLGDPHATILAWTARDPRTNVYAVADRLAARGWSLDRQQRPASIHHTFTSNHLPVASAFVADLGAACDEVAADPGLAASGEAPMYGLMAKVPLRGMVKGSVLKVMESLYGPSGDAPDLTRLPEGASVVDRLVHRFGAPAVDALGRLEALRDGVRDRLRGAR